MRIVATMGRTPAGSVLVTFEDLSGGARKARRDRLLSATILDIAAAMERVAAEIDATWCVSPKTYDRQLVVELSDEDKADNVADLVRLVMGDASSVEIVQ